MPVPVEGPRPMATPKTSKIASGSAEEAPPSASPAPDAKIRKLRKRKGKEPEDVDPPADISQPVEDKSWTWKPLTESSASRVAPVFTKDGRYFFSVVESSVKIYSVATGRVVSTLAAPPPSESATTGGPSRPAAVTAAILNPHNPFQLITGSADGLVRFWDFLDAIVLRTLKLPYVIMHLAAHEKFKDHIFAAVASGTKKKTHKSKKDSAVDNAYVLQVSFQPTDASASLAVQVPSDIYQIGRARGPTGLGFSPSGAWLVATGGHKAYVCPTSDFKAGFTKFVSPQALTCLAFHPSEEYFATGDAIGCIRLWYCLNSNLPKTYGVEKKAQTTTMHWHAHAVSSIAFTANGAYLVSGGEEAVLVIWQLHSGQREYIPRVGAPIAHVSVSKAADGEEEYLLSLVDASFAFVRSGTLSISRTISRVKLDPATSQNQPSASSPAPLAVHFLTSALILPSSHGSTLQAFSPSSAKLLYELEVTPSNRVSRRDEKALEQPRVQHAVIDELGEWLVTIDWRESDETFRAESHMKIWRWHQKSATWTLNTRVDRPHGLHRVTAVAFRPVSKGTESIFVTTGEDGNIKSWRVQSTTQKSGETDNFWVSRCTLSSRSGTPSHVSWSTDGSLFAVSMGPHVAIYDGQTNILCQVLTSPECPLVASAHFVGSSGRYVAVVGPRDLILWDLLSHSVRWQFQSSLSIDRLVAHPREESFSLFERLATQGTPSTRVLVFHPSSSLPVASWTVPFHLRNVVSHASLDRLSANPLSFTLVGITDTWSVVVFGDDVCLPQEDGSTARGIGTDGAPGKRTLFQDIFGKSAFAGLTNVPASSSVTLASAQPWSGREVAEVFDAPTYLMPPLGSLFDNLLDGFLTPRLSSDVPNSPTAVEHVDEDVDMADEGDDEPFTVDTRIERVVNKQEMESFIGLFKNYGISAPTQMPTQPNGVSKTNGMRNPTVNGHAHTPSSTPNPPNAKTVAQKAEMPGPTSVELAPSPMSVNGRKRKQSAV
ncbi:hypothetical protein POSPLADRAFT_1051423 [Postia placenta MAD-698-R-SB12]|uniref:WD repeat-containing protein 75 second beta-propeller domain-containing protein n=1 Tax=Postia placenta MAD-698-R-SB12 TaxID=670580 RepID=A0A1X6NFZ6_9APHY|nr:hypothetical protein POSPLADRAFT_1051423 [Postia placenta MAD-698-R-SB12]OSX67273.1 hypothetical protein POSPLADRAFT_1051423 [Postia placenta MAD-698-R-SB12]